MLYVVDVGAFHAIGMVCVHCALYQPQMLRSILQVYIKSKSVIFGNEFLSPSIYTIINNCKLYKHGRVVSNI